MESLKTFTCAATEEGMRLDVFLHQKLSPKSRSQVKKLIDDALVQLNGAPTKAARLLKEGDVLQVKIPKPTPLSLKPEAFPLKILYEDSEMIVLDKPAEKVVHPGAGIRQGTLVHALLHHCQDLSGIGGKLRPGIVHRLDKGTSGVLVIAKNDRAHNMLSEQFKSRQVEKTYLALVWGTPEPSEGEIDQPLGRDPKDRKKISSRSSQTRNAFTEYRVLKSYGAISFLELKPHTGRTHQLRVHLSERGHPVVGDPTYGKGLRRLASLPKTLQDFVKALKFQMLHASRLTLIHPTQQKPMTFEAPLRSDMEALLRLLQE